MSSTISSFRIIVATVLLFSPHLIAAGAQTYYVDAILGDDTWTGTSPTPQTNDGPWETIGQVNNTFLRPGDLVLFKCGEVWREQLVVSYSGNAGNPITFGSYGGCTGSNKPVIDGSVPVNNWTLNSGIYSTSLQVFTTPPYNLLINGTFDVDNFNWDLNTTSWIPESTCGDASGGCLLLDPVAVDYPLTTTNNFELESGKQYRLKFRARVEYINTLPAVSVIVRRFDNSDEVLNKALPDISMGWQPFSFDFVSNVSYTDMRLYFQIPKVAGNKLYFDSVILSQTSPEEDVVRQVFLDDQIQELAHYPNRDFDPVRPDSLFLSAKDDPNNIDTVTSFAAGDDLALTPTQEQDMTGAGIHVFAKQFTISDCEVDSYDGGTKRFTNIDTNPVVVEHKEFLGETNCDLGNNVGEGEGYYLDNKLWMVDEPGEWYYDPVTEQLHLQTDSGTPENRADAGYRIFGVYARARSYIVIDGLSIRRSYRGIEMDKATGFEILNTDITDSDDRAISAWKSQQGLVDDCTINNSGRGAIWGGRSTDLVVTNNAIIDTGTIGPPRSTRSAVYGTDNAAQSIVSDNDITNSASIAISVRDNSTISNNYVVNSCMIFSDCGALYTHNNPNGSQITDNIVINSVGNPDGRPSTATPFASGIYLDGSADGVQVTGNTVVNTDLGFHLNTGTNNSFTNNTIFGSKRKTVLRNAGNSWPVDNNSFINNVYMPLNELVTYHTSSGSPTANAVVYAGNRHSLLYSDVIGYEGILGVETIYDLLAWEQAKSETGATAFYPFGMAFYKVLSVDPLNFVTNGNFEANTNDWGSSCSCSIVHETGSGVCANGNCLNLSSPTTKASLISTLDSTIEEGKLYRLKFDLKSGSGPQLLTTEVYELGNGDKPLGHFRYISAENEWETYNFVFESTFKASNDPATTTKTAKIAFRFTAGNAIYLDNVSFEEVTANANDTSDDAAIITNPSYAAVQIDCENTTIDPARCNEYVHFGDASPVTWPVTVPAWGSRIVVWAANPYQDSDRDGVDDQLDDDDDNDGLTDAVEAQIGSDPLRADTDGDDVSDYDEVNYDGDPATYTPGQDLNPLSSDSDGDGYDDGVELLVYGSDPLNAASIPNIILDGDINLDGQTNVGDILLVQRYLLGLDTLTQEQIDHGDYRPLPDGDHALTLADLLLIIQAVVFKP